MELSKENERPPGPPVDIIQPMIGSFGKYHLFLCFIVFVTKFPIAWHQMAIIFLSPKVSYKCPVTDSCPCSDPKYDKSIFTNSIIMQWDLICEKKFLVTFSQMIFQLGVLIGSVLFGMASDRLGRRNPMIAAVIMQVLAGLGAAFVPEFWMFSVLRFFIGVSVGGTMVIGFVIIMEFVGTKYREPISALYQIPFNLGHLSLPLFGYLFRDYSKFQLWISLPTILLLVYICILPESPRWLLATRKADKAIPILEKVARINNLPVDKIRAEVEASQAQKHNIQLKKGTIVDLFRTPNIRKNILVMSYSWLTCSYCFYGVSQYVGQLSGNVFINVAIGACLTTVATFASIPVMKILGRKPMLVIVNFMCGVCLLILAFIPEGIGRVILASVGQVSSFVAFVLVYLYCSELFPTVVRNAAIGFSSMMARVGSMIAPSIIDLKSVAAWMPPIAFGILPLIAALLAFLLPETKGCELMTTIEEGEAFGKKRDTSKDTKDPKLT